MAAPLIGGASVPLQAAGGGNHYYNPGVGGPTTSTDTAIARWSGTLGRYIQDSSVLIDGSGNTTLPNTATLSTGYLVLNQDGNGTTTAIRWSGDDDSGITHKNTGGAQINIWADGNDTLMVDTTSIAVKGDVLVYGGHVEVANGQQIQSSSVRSYLKLDVDEYQVYTGQYVRWFELDGGAIAPVVSWDLDAPLFTFNGPIVATGLTLANDWYLSAEATQFDIEKSAGTARFRVGADGRVRIMEAGTAADPAVTHYNADDTGRWYPDADSIAWSTSGTEAFRVSDSAVTASRQVLATAGSIGAPGYSFSGATDTGWMLEGTGEVVGSVDGTLRMHISPPAFGNAVYMRHSRADGNHGRVLDISSPSVTNSSAGTFDNTGIRIQVTETIEVGTPLVTVTTNAIGIQATVTGDENAIGPVGASFVNAYGQILTVANDSENGATFGENLIVGGEAKSTGSQVDITGGAASGSEQIGYRAVITTGGSVVGSTGFDADVSLTGAVNYGAKVIVTDAITANYAFHGSVGGTGAVGMYLDSSGYAIYTNTGNSVLQRIGLLGNTTMTGAINLPDAPAAASAGIYFGSDAAFWRSGAEEVSWGTGSPSVSAKMVFDGASFRPQVGGGATLGDITNYWAGASIKDLRLVDGTIQTTGGNARGLYAVDLQGVRVAATQVASANYSGVLWGRNNTASGMYSAAGGLTSVASANHAIAFGNGSSATALYALALSGGEATAEGSIAIGENAVSDGLYSVSAVGGTANGDYSLAMFTSATASGNYGIAIGHSSTAHNAGGIVLGTSHAVYGINSIGIGSSNSTAIGDDYVTIVGYSSTTNVATHSVAIGYDHSITSSNSTTALGRHNIITGSASSVILGHDNVTSNGSAYSVAVGYANDVQGQDSIAIGNQNSMSGIYASRIAIGRQNAFVSSGAYGITIGESNYVEFGSHQVAIGYDNTIYSETSIAVGRLNSNTVGSDYSFIGGYNNTVTGDYGVAVGYQNDMPGNDSIAIGRAHQDLGAIAQPHRTSIGYNNTMGGPYVVGIGTQNTVGGEGSIAIGLSNQNYPGSAQNYTIGIGYSNATYSNYTVAIGYDNTAYGDSSIAIGRSNANLNSLDTFNILMGYSNFLNSVHSTMIGYDNTASSSADYAVVIGDTNDARGVYPVVIGYSNALNVLTDASYAVVLGYNHSVGASQGVAIGYQHTVVGNSSIMIGTLNGDFNGSASNYAVGIGYSNQVWQSSYGIAIGYDNTVYGDTTLAIGRANTSTAGDDYNVLIGYSNSTDSDRNILIGYDNTVNSSSNPSSIAIGDSINTGSSYYANIGIGRTHSNSGVYGGNVAIGNGITTQGNDTSGAIVIGNYRAISINHQVAGVAAAIPRGNYILMSTQSVTNGVSPVGVGANAVALNTKTRSADIGIGSVLIGNVTNTATGGYSISIGDNVGAAYAYAISIGGDGVSVGADYAVQVGGLDNSASAAYSLVIGGSDNTASGIYSVALGRSNIASGLAAMAFGRGNTASEAYAFAGGFTNNIAAQYATAFGRENDIDVNSPYALTTGYSNDLNNADYSVVFGYNHTVNNFQYGMVGGYLHSLNGAYSFVAGRQAIIEGGSYNTILAGYQCRSWETGSYNLAQGYLCEVGQDTVAGNSNAWAIGYRAKTRATGSFTWADTTVADYVNSVANSFKVRASGGIYFAGDTMPDTTTTYDLGGTSNVWQRIYAQIPDTTDVAGKRHLVLDGTLVKQMSSAGATGGFYDGSGNVVNVVNGIITGVNGTGVLPL